MLLNPKTSNSGRSGDSAISKAFPPTSYPGLSSDPFNIASAKGSNQNVIGSNLGNVKSLRDLNSSDSQGNGNAGRAITGSKKPTEHSLQGRGYSLNSQDSTLIPNNSKDEQGKVDRAHLREIWTKRFADNKTDGKKEDKTSNDDPSGNSMCLLTI